MGANHRYAVSKSEMTPKDNNGTPEPKVGRLRGFLDSYSGGQLTIQLTPERFGEIWRDIVVGSEPAPRYYIMVVVSTLIAGMGLVADSTAVVIGAMLVAPLMTPIFGISLGLVRGNTRLVNKALKAEIVGVFVAVGMGYLVGLFLARVDPGFELTREMVSRTQPNLFDLIVALMAGFAGAYAIVDKNISPALPGVAIATAIVPPLANSGLCFAQENYTGGMGSFLLFTANFLSIHLISAVLFFRVGLGRDYGEETTGVMVRRFGVTVALFAVIAVIFGYFLYDIMKQRELRNDVFAILSEELSDYAATGIDDLVISKADEKYHVLARIYSTGDFDPNQVERIESRLNQSLHRPVDLVVRAIKTADISARGANVLGTDQNPEGFFFDDKTPASINLLRMAEQTVREMLADRVGMDFVKVEYLKLPKRPALQVVVTGFLPPSAEDIRKLQKLISTSAGIDNLLVVVRYIDQELLTANGPVSYAWTNFIELPQEQKTAVENGKQKITDSLKDNESLLLDTVYGVVVKGGYVFLAEVEGQGDYTRAQLDTLRGEVSEAIGAPATVYVRLNKGPVLTEAGLQPYGAVLEKQLVDMQEESGEYLREMLRSTR